MNLTTEQSKVTLYLLNTYPWCPNFGPFHSTISRLRDRTLQGRRKSEMHRMTPNWTWTLNYQKYPIYTLSIYPWYPKFGPFGHTVSRFWDAICTRSPKIGNAPNDPNWTWTLNSQKYSIYTKYSLRPKFWSVSLYNELFTRYNIHVQGHQKSEKQRMTPNWTWTLNIQKYSIYTKYLPMRPRFWSVSLYDQRSPRYRRLCL